MCAVYNAYMTAPERKESFTWQQKKAALARQLTPYRSTLIFLSVLEILTAIGNGVVPYITGRFFDGLITPRMLVLPYAGSVPFWEALIAAWVVIQVFVSGVSWVIDRRTRRLTTELEAGIQARAYAHLLTVPLGFFKKARAGEITETISRAAWMLSALTGTITSLAPQFLTILIGIVISFLILPQLALLMVAGIALYVVILVAILPATSRVQMEAFNIWNRTAGDAQDAYANFQTVKQAGAEAYEGERIRAGFHAKAIPLWYRLEVAWSNMTFAQRIIVAGVQGLILLFSVYYVTSGAITIGELIAFNAYAGMIIGPFVALGNQWQTLQNGLVAVARVEKIFATPSEVYAPKDTEPLGVLQGNVGFKGVHFRYEPKGREILAGISFEARAGQSVALVGETGVGKSTTTELISGYYFPTEGTVEIDGHDIRRLSLTELRSQIAVVPQEVVLFNASIADNIRYGRPEASDEEVHRAAERAHADAFIAKFQNGYAQEVGERGVKLSVGQKQRIAIARAMLRNPRILILDEPTSALDPETEQYISKALEELMHGRTTFIVAHRLSTVRKANLILVLKDGKITERGTHEELLTLPNGIYRRLYELHIGLHE